MKVDFYFLVFDFQDFEHLLKVSDTESRSFAVEIGQELDEIDVMIDASATLPSFTFRILN